MRKSYPRRRGVVILWMSLLLLVFIGFMGLALDWGFVVWTGQKLQNAADAAALAGAAKLADGEVEVNDAAIYLASENEAAGFSVALDRNDEDNAADGEIVVGVYDRDDRSFTPTLSSPNAVRVWARKTEASSHGGTQLFFGPVFGKDTADISRFAIAMAEGGPSSASVIALDPNDRKSFYLHGNVILDLGSGAVQVNSDHSSEAGLIQGNSTLLASDVNLVGELGFNGNSYTYDGDANPDSPFIPDPLADLPVPANGPQGRRNGSAVNSITSTGTYSPGYYSEGLDINNSVHATLQPGIYVLKGKGNKGAFTVNGQARITGYGVMFYIVSGEVHVNGGGVIRLTPPADGVYEGITFFQSRSNTKSANFNGNSLMGGELSDGSDGTGVFYFPNALLQVGGTADTYVSKLIANNIEVYGNGRKTVIDGYDTDDGLDVVFLVE